jgi:transcriptional regulator with XRE-family HTH domain
MPDKIKSTKSRQKRMKDAKTLGKKLLAARLEKGLTLEQLVGLSGVGIGTISELERGLRMPNTSTLMSLAGVLEVSLKVLTGA